MLLGFIMCFFGKSYWKILNGERERVAGEGKTKFNPHSMRYVRKYRAAV
jgi:hypothetical protein